MDAGARADRPPRPAASASAGVSTPRGEEVEPLDADSVRAAAAALRDRGRRGRRRDAAVLVHQRRRTNGGWATILAEELPGTVVSLSSRVVPEFREYVRASTTALNASLLPLMGAYLGAVTDEVAGEGVSVPLHMMQTNGGVAPAARARELPIAPVRLRPGRRRDRWRPPGRAGRRERCPDLRHGRHHRRHRPRDRRQPAAAASPARPPGCRSTCPRSTCSASAPAAARSPASTQFGSLTVGPAERRRRAGPRRLRPRRRGRDRHRRPRGARQPRRPRARWPTACRLTASWPRAAVAAAVGEPLGPGRGGGRRRDPAHRQRQHGKRPARHDDRPRPRPAPLRAGRHRRGRPHARLRPGR